MSIRLLIADDHDLMREGLRLTFEVTEVQVVAEASDGQEAFEHLNQHDVDVALVDIQMPRADGYVFLQLVKETGMVVGVLMHTLDCGTNSVRRCRELGARGLIAKNGDGEALLNAVRRVHAGEEVWDYGW
jgi:DNA-binding NarL/FixJ family response regulator